MSSWLTAGHQVSLALRNLRWAQMVYPEPAVTLCQAPFQHGVPVTHPRVTRLSQILDNTGFQDADALLARCRAWRALYDSLDPDLVLFDHAPTALLAARGRSFATATLSNGFFIPPHTRRWPDLAGQAGLADGRDVDHPEVPPLLARANAVAQALGAPTLDTIADLYRVDQEWLRTYPELDPYAGERRAPDYVGTLDRPLAIETEPRWPAGGGDKVFAYLSEPTSPPQLLGALARTGCSVLAYAPPLDRRRIRAVPDNLRLLDRPVHFAAIEQHAAAVICNGTHGTLASALCAGKPLLSVPFTLEQSVHAARVAELGAGLTVSGRAPADATGALRRLVTEPRFTEAAHRFAQRYRGWGDSTTTVLERADRLLCARSG
ncbi:MAG: nucleotide disphospho-sugar-binding domain-containing protein [Pseudomonadota bacterium]|nr:nucleotide disphospho-sugar-binding domain-containing protein [Pseudomonadota bacterium]